MTRKVKAYGRVIAFPADMTNDQISEILIKNRDRLDPNYKPEGATASDYVRGFAVGANRLVSGIGWLADKAGAEKIGKALDDLGTSGAAYHENNMTEGGKKALNSSIVEEDSQGNLKMGDNWKQATGMAVMGSLPSMVAGGGVGGVLAKGAQLTARAVGSGGATSALLGGTAAPITTGGKILARSPAAVGFGAGEGLIAGGQSAAEVKKAIINMPEKELEKSPVYASLKEQHGAMKARKLLAEQASEDSFLKTGAAVGTIGAVTGGGALGQAYQKATVGSKGGILQEGAKGAAIEAVQETPQSGAETLLGNLNTKEYLDPSVDPMKGVAASAVSGGIVGGITGGVFGSAGAVNMGKDYHEKAKAVASAINEEKMTNAVANITEATSVEEAIQHTANAIKDKPLTGTDILTTVDPTLKDIVALTGQAPIEPVVQEKPDFSQYVNKLSNTHKIEIDDSGNLVRSFDNNKNIKQALAGYTREEQRQFLDNNGQLSDEGAKILSGMMSSKAFGESLDSLPDVPKAVMLKNSGLISNIKSKMDVGAIPSNLDITDNLIEGLSAISNNHEYLNEEDIDPDTASIINYLKENINNQPVLNKFVSSLYQNIGNVVGQNTGITPKDIIDDAGQKAKLNLNSSTTPQQEPTVKNSNARSNGLEAFHVNLKLTDESGKEIIWRGNKDKHPGRTRADVAIKEVDDRVSLLKQLKECLG